MCDTLYHFGDVVVVEGHFIGVVVKCFKNSTYDIFVKQYDRVENYKESGISLYTGERNYIGNLAYN